MEVFISTYAFLKSSDLELCCDSGGRGAASIRAVSQGGRVSLWAEARLCGSQPGGAAG